MFQKLSDFFRKYNFYFFKKVRIDYNLIFIDITLNIFSKNSIKRLFLY